MALAQAPPFAAPAPDEQPRGERWRVQGGDTATPPAFVVADPRRDAPGVRRAPDVPDAGALPGRGHAPRDRRSDAGRLRRLAVPGQPRRRRDGAGGTSAATNEDVLGFQFVCKGVELVREGGRELALQAGDVVLWDGMQPTEVEIVQAFYKRTLLFPREQVIAVCPRLAELSALPSMAGSGPARLLVRYMNALALELPAARAGRRRRGRERRARAAARRDRAPAADQPRRRARRDAGRDRPLRAHASAGSRRSGPRRSRAPTRCRSGRCTRCSRTSTRRSRGSCADERLARCLEDLQRANGGSVTDIAFRWGFCDAAHFSRVFKREFGATPSEVRARPRATPRDGSSSAARVDAGRRPAPPCPRCAAASPARAPATSIRRPVSSRSTCPISARSDSRSRSPVGSHSSVSSSIAPGRSTISR